MIEHHATTSATGTQAMNVVLERIDRLHSAPEVAQTILKITGDADFDIYELVKCVEHDPALTARIMSVVNSSHFGLGQPIGNLRLAVAFLGRRSLRLIALTFSVVDALTKGVSGQFFHDYWQRALTMATAGRRLAVREDHAHADDAYTAGLLADVGMLILAQTNTEAYTRLYDDAQQDQEFISAEINSFGFSHAELAAHALGRWGFPTVIADAARQHHEFGTADEGLDLVVQTANLVSDVLWTAESPQLPKLRQVLRERFEMETDDLIQFALDCKEDIRHNAEMFQIDLQSTGVDCNHLVSEAHNRFVDASLESAIDLDSFLAISGDDSR